MSRRLTAILTLTLALAMLTSLLCAVATAAGERPAGASQPTAPTTYPEPLDLPQLYISYSGTVTKEQYIPASLRLDTPTGDTQPDLSDKAGEIRIRGQSTSKPEKAAFNIKFSTAVDLFDMGRSKKWCLLANNYDKTLIRNALVMELAPKLRLPFTLEFRYVELYVNGDYFGCYMLCEGCDISPGRIDISPELGDFQLEVETQRTEEGTTIITTPTYGHRFYLADPELPTALELEHINSTLRLLERVVKGGEWEKICTYIDMDSFVDAFILNDFFKSVDCQHHSTRFLWMDGKMYAGPSWDFDLSSGNSVLGSYLNGGKSWEEVWAYMPWYRQLCEHPEFLTLVADRYEELDPLLENVYLENELGISRIDYWVEALYPAIWRNFRRWDVTLRTGYEMKPTLPTYEQALAFLEDWMVRRHNWLRDHFRPYQTK